VAAPKRSEDRLEADRATIARRYLQGRTQAEIAAELGMTQQMVSYDLQVVRQRWRQSGIRDLDEAKAIELAKLDELERTYWEAWRASVQAAPPGTPTYLQGVLGCIDRRVKLLGLDAPERVDVELRVRAMAEALGLDPDAAVREAVEVVREWRARGAAR
jgi:hypothetical protein